MKQTFCRVMVAVADQMPTRPTLAQIEQFTVVIPHLKEATTTLQPWLTDADIFKPSTRIAQFYEGQVNYREALSWYLHCREISEERLGENHSDVAASLGNLAGLYRLQGRYAKAEPLYLRALAIGEAQLGENHPDVATRLDDLALLYKSQGRYAEAEPLYLRALTILFNTLGTDHPNSQQVLQNFLIFLSQVIQTGQAAQLSDHPLTQDLLRQMQERMQN
jgi:tetratricopeptide (TPR) repeat protein